MGILTVVLIPSAVFFDNTLFSLAALSGSRIPDTTPPRHSFAYLYVFTWQYVYLCLPSCWFVLYDLIWHFLFVERLV